MSPGTRLTSVVSAGRRLSELSRDAGSGQVGVRPLLRPCLWEWVAEKQLLLPWLPVARETVTRSGLALTRQGDRRSSATVTTPRAGKPASRC